MTYAWPEAHFGLRANDSANRKEHLMLAGLTKSAINLVKSNTPAQRPVRDVPELLSALTTVRAKIAELEHQEKEILAATAAKLREHESALEELKKKAQGCGIEILAPVSYAPPVSPSESASRQHSTIGD
jgi:hypothetical protein